MDISNNQEEQDKTVNKNSNEHKFDREKTQKIEDEYPYLTIDDKEYIDFHFYNPDFKFSFSVLDFKNQFVNYTRDANYVEVEFKCGRRKIFINTDGLNLDVSEYVIVEVDNGYDIGTVTAVGKKALERYNTIYKNDNHITKVLRHATEEDLTKYKKNIIDEFEIVEKTKNLIKEYNFDMKICEAEWQLDRQRLTIYFTAPQRIDFRELVKELAKTFKTRIELRQISTREEAKRLGGIGPCGISLCCTNMCSENCHVTLDHARLQKLSNNVSKLSGYCGRLKCCLLYEHHFYLESIKKYPPLDSIVELPEGNARIVKVDIFKDKTYLYNETNGTYINLSYEEIEKLRSNGKIKIPERESTITQSEDFHFPEDLIDPELLENDF